MSMSMAMAKDLLELLFQNADMADIGDTTGLQGSGTAGVFAIALHTSDPTEGSSPGDVVDQSTNECTYTGYGRETVARSGAGWTVAAGTSPADVKVSNAAAITFGACSAGSETATHFSVGKTDSSPSDIIFVGALDSGLAISAGITPQFAIGALVVTLD